MSHFVRYSCWITKEILRQKFKVTDSYIRKEGKCKVYGIASSWPDAFDKIQTYSW